ncbi:Hypothetical predicted protein [Pelobates cultripes]|uniref:exodeoxyribonuclease III n=1 Tax=Pelobates cultripes TaxID=61616 RepID=A0AAD1QY56_PELCU|nr:Hypothetical predicted protein [Pelobates cultripes]
MAATRAFAPAQLTYWSNNVQGLNSPEKRAHLHRRLWSAKASVVFLQETHLKGGDAPKLENRRFPLGFYANHPDTKKAGVAILFAHSVPFQNTQTLADPNGRYLFLRGTIADHEYTFACLYGPNRKQHKFLRQVLAKLEKFRGALLIVAGDLNMPLDPIRDTSRGQSAIPTHCLKAAQRFLHKMGLVDCWRTYHPDDRDYTHYSAVHAHYSRIDYIFMAQEYLNLLRSADLGIMDHSDHAPVLIDTQSPLFKPRERHDNDYHPTVRLEPQTITRETVHLRTTKKPGRNGTPVDHHILPGNPHTSTGRWHANPTTKQWVHIEIQQALGKIPAQLWLGETSLGNLRTDNPMINATLQVWCKVRYTRNLTTSPNPLTPITNNPKLAGGLSPADLRNLGATDWVYISQWCDGPNLKTMGELLQDRRPTRMD